MNTKPYTLITGSSSGIGREITRYCAMTGRNVLLVALPSSGLEMVHKEIISKFGVDSEFLETDLASPGGPQEVIDWVMERGYEVDFLVNNAGLAGTSVFESSSLHYNDERIMVNIRALVLLTRLFLPLLRKHEQAYILNVGSLSAFYAVPYKSLYSASKAFVLNFSRALRTELQGSGISVSVLCPNGVRTNEGSNLRIDTHGSAGRWTAIRSDEVARISVEKTLWGKFLIIPGGMNIFLMVLSKVIPGFLQQRIMRREFEKEVAVSLKLQEGLTSESPEP